MKLCLVVILLISGLMCCHGLTQGEEEALSAMIAAWPELTGPTWNWSHNVSIACSGIGFYGVSCSSNPNGHIVGLYGAEYLLTLFPHLKGIILQNPIPDSTGNLEYLTVLSLVDTNVTGSLPSTLQNLVLLRELVVHELDSSHIGLSGSLPEWLSNLKQLETVSLFSPGMYGRIPKSIGQLPNLRSLALGSAQFTYTIRFTGEIPYFVCSLKNLEMLDLSGTMLDGVADFCVGSRVRHLALRFMSRFEINIARLLQDFPLLEHLDIYGSQRIYGSPFRAPLYNFRHLDFGNTLLRDTIPPSFWSLSNLTYVSFSQTSISGTIGNEVGSLSSLTHLVLSLSAVTGTVPPSLGNCTKLEVLDLTGLPLTGTIPPELGNLSNLQALQFAGAYFQFSTIPDSLGKLKNLRSLGFSDCKLMGTIPASLENLSHLQDLDLQQNSFTGTIPNLSASLVDIDLSNNLLHGQIPDSLFASAGSLHLFRNHLGPAFPRQAFSKAFQLSTFDSSYNQFIGDLPSLPSPDSGKMLRKLALSFNNFAGTIPPEYGTLISLDLAGNQLEGSLGSILTPESSLTELNVRSNKLSGNFAGIHITSPMTKLVISDNKFVGKLPIIPPSVEVLDCSRNNFVGPLSLWLSSALNTNLRHLDLSLNNFTGTLPPEMLVSRLQYLSLANNQLEGELPTSGLYSASMTPTNLIELDLSHNQFSGTFPILPYGYPMLSSLRASSNLFTGRVPFESMPILSYLDLSNNRFRFATTEILTLGSLVSVDLSNNQIGGILSLTGLTQLQIANFEGCDLLGLDFDSISHRVVDHKLEILEISGNVDLAGYLGLSPYGATRTSSESPSLISGVSCHGVTFHSTPGFSFIFDEELFNYAQCDCDATHYGFPPGYCFACPPETSCGRSLLHVAPNSFAFTVSAPLGPNMPLTDLQVEPCGSDLEIGHSSSSASSTAPLTSNCIGILINGTALRSEENPTPMGNFLESQCKAGSSGRLCSRCLCDPTGQKNCYFQGTFTCERCKGTLRLSHSLPAAFGVIFCVIIGLSIVMALVLRGRRSPREKPWHELPLIKRFVYRLIFMTTLGNWTISINFVQILVELTHWDALAFRAWVKLLNGDGEGLGLICFFPFLSQPLIGLIVRLLLPLFVIIVVAISIGLAELYLRLLEWKRNKSMYPPESSSAESEHENLLPIDKKSHKTIAYPARALLSSISLSVIKFLYFGSVLTAYDYIFPSVQPYTKEKYVMAHPWMRYAEANELRYVSAPFVALYTVLIPAGFLALAWRVRSSFTSPAIAIFIGSLFESFSRRYFWWEIVNVLRKVAVALILRGISRSSAVQVALVVVSIGIPMLLQTSFQPWKRRVENLMEPIGCFLLILSLTVARSFGLSSFHDMRTTMLVADVAFIAVNIGLIVYLTITGETEYQRIWNAQYGAQKQGTSINDDDLLETRTALRFNREEDDTYDAAVLDSMAASED